MRKLEALTAVTFTTGRFKLTPEQMQRRRYVVKVIDAERLIVEPKGEISFKRGEIIETDIEIGKANVTLKPLDEEVAQAPNDQPSAAAPSAPLAGDTTGGESTATAAPADAAPDDPLAHVSETPPSAAPKRGGSRR